MYFIRLWTYWSRRVLTPPQPSPFLLPGGCEFPDQHLSSFLTPNLMHQLRGMAEKSDSAVAGEKEMSKTLFLGRIC